MFKDIFSNRLFIGAFAFFVLCVGGSLLYMQHVKRQSARELAETEERIKTLTERQNPQPKTEVIKVAETPQGGHVHEDGTFHAEPHETPAVPEVRNVAPPGAVTTPDFPAVEPNEDPVEAAYKRLEYIKNNPYAWGGVRSERATQLIAQLLPLPVIIDHGHGDEVSELMYELTLQDDPRAAEVFAAPMSATEGYMGGNLTINALVEIGPPAVPYILPHLEKGVREGGYIRRSVFKSLGRIGELYRGDLGGIVDHIIIPKLEVIAADENNEFYERAAVIFSQEALSVLQ